MEKKARAKKPPQIESTDAIKQFLTEYGGDGWAIIKPEYLVKIGFSPKLVKKMTYVQKSNKKAGPKGMLFDNAGNPVDKLTGVYSLAFWYAIADNIGADTREAYSKMGRGFQAQSLARSISQKLGLTKETEDGGEKAEDKRQDTGAAAGGNGESGAAVASGEGSQEA